MLINAISGFTIFGVKFAVGKLIMTDPGTVATAITVAYGLKFGAVFVLGSTAVIWRWASKNESSGFFMLTPV